MKGGIVLWTISSGNKQASRFQPDEEGRLQMETPWPEGRVVPTRRWPSCLTSRSCAMGGAHAYWRTQQHESSLRSRERELPSQRRVSLTMTHCVNYCACNWLDHCSGSIE
jgi:sulfite reductase beta subunit-like hemoprotein